MSRRKLGAEERIALSKEYLRGETGYEKIAKKYSIGISTAKDIIAVYEAEGEEGFLRRQWQLQYSTCLSAEERRTSIRVSRYGPGNAEKDTGQNNRYSDLLFIWLILFLF